MITHRRSASYGRENTDVVFHDFYQLLYLVTGKPSASSKRQYSFTTCIEPMMLPDPSPKIWSFGDAC